MPLREIVTGLFVKDADRFIYAPIPPGQVVGGQADTGALVAGRDYFRIWLSEMSLRRDRAWFTTWHPAVHSLVSFQFGQQIIDLPNIAGQQRLDGVDPAHLNRSIQLNYKLTPLMPFSGGVVELDIALLAMKGEDYLKRFIGVLNNFAGLLAVPQLSAVLSVAAPVATGITELLGSTNGEMHLGLHQSYVQKDSGQNELKPGYYAAVLATEKQVPPASLCVVNDRLRRGSVKGKNVPFDGYAYLLLRIQKETKRDDWEGLTSIMQPFGAAIAALGDGRPDVARTCYGTAIAEVIKSPDLTQADRQRVSRTLFKRFESARELGLGATATWPSFAKQIAEIPVDEALAAGEPELAEFLPRDSAGWSPSGLAESG
ncbi:MAG TPA: hypothetical protein VFQ44_19125 [Streptosporangiaceae bacterium]|nr:hypothetical protein [Streptosporangiaceae bacterium]